MTQREHAQRFSDLHVKGDPLILYNVWDAGSAKALAEVGAKAIATGSWSVAAAHGVDDGEQLPLDDVIANARRIVESVALPVSIDFEGAYGSSPASVRANVAKLIGTGSVGINIEDQVVGGEGLYSLDDQCARIAAARDAAESLGVQFFINARTDGFLKSKPERHDESMLAEAERRAKAYATAGASGLFAPGLRDARLIEKLCRSSTLPVNILFVPDTLSHAELAALGVARISYGPRPYREMIQALKEKARLVLARR